MPMMGFGPIIITNSTFYHQGKQRTSNLSDFQEWVVTSMHYFTSIIQHFSQELRSLEPLVPQLPAPPVLGEPLGPPVLPLVALGEAPGGAGQRPGGFDRNILRLCPPSDVRTHTVWIEWSDWWKWCQTQTGDILLHGNQPPWADSTHFKRMAIRWLPIFQSVAWYISVSLKVCLNDSIW